MYHDDLLTVNRSTTTAVAPISETPSADHDLASSTCEQCDRPFQAHGRGSRQRFCSPQCRRIFHNSHRAEVKSQAPQASQAPQVETPQRLAETLSPTQTPLNSNDFDWSEEVLAVREQAAIAVYPNPADDVVIRQRGSWPEDDVWVIITRQNLSQLISRLQQFERGGL